MQDLSPDVRARMPHNFVAGIARLWLTCRQIARYTTASARKHVLKGQEPIPVYIISRGHPGPAVHTG